ncbi:hypothetical protein HAQ03_05245 [Acidithiobacillus caldus]|jgi:hypothetical protein|uniref:hypothetical protein n=1 Tax=Acidithiobacillus caldus TaxID=33059 RepID=UPI001C0758E8|nr:hypothetical protein [Acidithiobacillus caldus]MBU2762832.1 hypothetical protein [Acidithiobacillus caldus]
MMTTKTKQSALPTMGERVHTVDGIRCYRFHPDMRGTVTGIIQDEWGTYAQVMMDNGNFRLCHGLCDGPLTQIGWHLLREKGGEE